MITGRCLCGAVRYEADGEPLFAVQCHCRDCQRASGTGHVPVLGVSKAGFNVSGATKSYAAIGGSQRAAVRHFCPVCGSLLFGAPEAFPNLITICAGTLDDPSVFTPAAALFTRDRAEWDHVAPGLTQFETTPPR